MYRLFSGFFIGIGMTIFIMASIQNTYHNKWAAISSFVSLSIAYIFMSLHFETNR